MKRIHHQSQLSMMKYLIATVIVLLSLVVTKTLQAREIDILAKYCRNIHAWQHIEKSDPTYTRLKKAISAYTLANTEKLCRDQAIDLVLVKKVINWQQQHVNGIEIDLAPLALSFKDIQQLDIAFEINAEQSSLINKSQLDSYFSSYYADDKEEKIQSIISGNYHFTLMLFSQAHQDQKVESLIANYHIIQKTEHGYKVSLSLPAKAFSYYWQKHYQETNEEWSRAKHEPFNGIILMAETPNNKVARHYLKDKYRESKGELFNEIAISLTDLSLTLVD